jgi:hypothetical protein
MRLRGKKSTYLHIVAEVVSHDTTEDVKADVGAGMTHVRVIVDSGSASVPCYFVSVYGHEFVLHAKN